MANSYIKNHHAEPNLSFSCRSRSGSEREVSELSVKTHLTIGYPDDSRMGIHKFVSEIWSFLNFYKLLDALEYNYSPVLYVEGDVTLVCSPKMPYKMIYNTCASTTVEHDAEKVTKLSEHFKFGISISDALSSPFYVDECYDWNHVTTEFIVRETYSKANDMIDHFVSNSITKAIEETTEPVDASMKRFHLDLEKPNDVGSYEYREVVPLKNDHVHPHMVSRCTVCALEITLKHIFFIKKELLPFDVTEIDKHYQMYKIHKKLSS